MSPAPSPGSAPAMTSCSSGSVSFSRSNASIAVCGSVQRSIVPVWQTYGRDRSTPSERSTWPESLRGQVVVARARADRSPARCPRPRTSDEEVAEPLRRDGIGRRGVLVAAPGAARCAGARGGDAAQRGRVVDDRPRRRCRARARRRSRSPRPIRPTRSPTRRTRRRRAPARATRRPCRASPPPSARQRTSTPGVGHQRQQRAQVVGRLRPGRVGGGETQERRARERLRGRPDALERVRAGDFEVVVERSPARVDRQQSRAHARQRSRARCVTERTQSVSRHRG